MNKQELIEKLKWAAKIEPLNEREIGFQVAKKEDIKLVEQLDELETLDEDWIEDHRFDYIVEWEPDTNRGKAIEVLNVSDVEKLLKPEQKVTEEQAWSKISEEYGIPNHSFIREALRVIADYDETKTSPSIGELKEKLEGPEKPVVPKWFDEWFKTFKGNSGEAIYHITRCGWGYGLEDSSGKDVGHDWTVLLQKAFGQDDDDKNKMAAIRAVEYGYEVEEEPKYKVSSSSEYGSGFWFLTKDNDGQVRLGTNIDYFEYGWDSLRLTEEEIKDYDKRYWAFREPVEEVQND